MSDLNLNFDNGLKNITMNNKSSDNIQILQSNTPLNNDNISSPNNKQLPNLSVSDPMGIEFLTKTSPNNSAENTPRTQEKNNEEFNFFKPSENNTNNNSTINKEDDIIVNQEVQNKDSQEFQPIHRLNPQDIKNEKIDLLYKFKKLENQGIRTTMNYNMNSHLEDMRNEYIKLKKQREIDNSIKFQRKMLMACVTGIEFLNGRFDPFNVKLDGWSESVNENLNDYDEIFEELNEKYGGTTDMAPELRLLFTLAGSAFMFHLSNTMFKSSIPGMDDVLQQNPELMKQFAEAAIGSMNNPRQPSQQSTPPPPNPLAAMMGMGGPGGGNPLSGLMGMMGGGGSGGGGPPPRQNNPSQNNPSQNNPSQNKPTSPTRSDMSGPDGIDELINKMNLQPNKIPDLDSISLMSGDTDKKSNSGITLNL